VAVFVLAVLLWVLVQGYPASQEEHGPLVLFRTYPWLIVGMVSGFFGATFSMLVQDTGLVFTTYAQRGDACHLGAPDRVGDGFDAHSENTIHLPSLKGAAL
jgi:hypothetical protein